MEIQEQEVIDIENAERMELLELDIEILRDKCNQLQTELNSYKTELSKVMPPDFKDWWQNDEKEWPMIAAGVIKSLREREEMAWEMACIIPKEDWK